MCLRPAAAGAQTPETDSTTVTPPNREPLLRKTVGFSAAVLDLGANVAGLTRRASPPPATPTTARNESHSTPTPAPPRSGRSRARL